MRSATKAKKPLEQHLKDIASTPDSFNFFVAIHHFVAEIERHPSFKALALPSKYSHFRQIYQGIEDLKGHPDRSNDLGHERYMVIQDLLKIQKQEVSDSNPLWRKRAMIRRFSEDIYKMLSVESPA